MNTSNKIGPTTPIRFRYKNHQGKTRVRLVIVKRIWFGQTKWHPEPQWFIRGHCTEHNADRDFALVDCDFLSFNNKYETDNDGKRNDGLGDPSKGEYNAFLGDDGSDIPCD